MKTKLLLAARCSISFLFFFLCASFLGASSFRSAANGSWQELSTWEVFQGTWVASTQLPSINDAVLIQSGHSIDILTIDAMAASIEVQSGATLRLLEPSYSLHIGNGNLTDADFIVDGTFQDYSNSGGGNGIYFNDGGTWRLGANGTMVKLNNSSAARYRDHYEGGMQNIPASANWIVRYIGLGHPSFCTNDTYYPNLTFESHAGHWNPAIGASRFQGSAGFSTILGNLSIGGSGSGSVSIYNQNTNSSGITVKGNCTIQSGSTLTNQGNAFGTGLQLAGNLQVQGTLDLSGGEGLLFLDGFSNQLIQGSGTILINDLRVNNNAGVSLFRRLEVGRNLEFWQGTIRLNDYDLTVWGEISGASSFAYVQTNGSGQLERLVQSSQYFPIGNNSFNPVIVDGSSPNTVKLRVEDWVLEQASWGEQLTESLVNRTWWLEGNTLSNYSLTLEWRSADELQGFHPENAYVAAHFGGAGWDLDTPTLAQGNNPYLLSRHALSGSAAFSIGSSGALPVELVSFRGTVVNSHVVLDWKTALEVRHDYFELERSTDGKQFERIASISSKAKEGFGASYQYQDFEASVGYNYYRLKSVSLDGELSFSKVLSLYRSAEAKRAEKVRIVKDYLALPIVEEEELLFIVYSITAGSFCTIRSANNNRLDVSKFPFGSYLLIWEQNGKQMYSRFIKV